MALSWSPKRATDSRACPGSTDMKSHAASTTCSSHRRRPGRVVAIALLALGLHTGCGREFFREWANQDASEAVYEKSRDPRYRLDLFSWEPPALARFADPYDRDRPPAPPDDFAAQSLSPVPQWPDHRLIMPIEGTGYLKLLDQGPRYDSPAPKPKPAPEPVKPKVELPPPPPVGGPPFSTVPSSTTPSTTTPPIPTPTPPPANPPGTPGPGASRSNSGTGVAAMSPTSLASKTTPAPASNPKFVSAVTPAARELAGRFGKDGELQRSSFQDPAAPMPTQTLPLAPDQPSARQPTNRNDPIQTPRMPGDPLPTDPDLSQPVNPRVRRPDLNPEQFKDAEEVASNLARMFVPDPYPMDEAVAAGLPAGSKPYLLTMEKAFQLALLNSRVYQFSLEQVYLSALPVTLQRFSFGPQFIAGLSPTTGVGGAGAGGGVGGGRLPTVLPTNSFTYTTRGSGSQTSALNMGTVAGVGKLFDNGASVLMSFANQIVFNFVGKNPLQPTVKSFLPFQAAVPFLRGGGRAVTLEPLTQAERSLLYSIRNFALFRQDFTVSTLTGGTEIQFGTNVTTGGFLAGSGNADPTTGFMNVVEDVQLVENARKNLSVFENFLVVYQELVKGESSGLTQLQVDQINQNVQGARNTLINVQTTYRNDLDQFKIQLGMPPDVPVIIDRTRTLPFKQTFESIDKWALSPKRELEDLDAIVKRLPDLEDLVLDGRSCHDVFKDEDGSSLEDLLVTAERIAMENRLDLMNARAALYDTWRQIRVAANALKGVLNVAVTNQILTPPTTNNPFGFVSQARSFGLVINAELPLVRVAERNTFVSDLIAYQRQRRTLMTLEDLIKFQLRSEIRQMQLLYIQFQVAERNLILSVRTKDQSFEQLVAPPQPGATSQGATQTINLITAQGNVIGQQNNLVTLWYNYQSFRLQVYRDLGILPFDEWEAFDEIFPPDRSQYGSDAAIGPDGRPAVAQPVKPATEVGRP
jgi:hypothetical protein